MQDTEKPVYIHKAKGMSDHFSIIPNAVAQNKVLSWSARGLLIYLLSLPSDWKIKKTELQRNSSTGREGTNSAFKELVDNGYIRIEVIPGKFSKPPENIYRVFSEPNFDLREAVNRKAVNGKLEAEKSAAEKPLTTKDTSPKEKSPKEKEQNTQASDFSLFEKNFSKAFDPESAFMSNLKDKYTGGAAADQLGKFKFKIESSPEKYGQYTPEQLRRAFIYHIQTRPTNEVPHKLEGDRERKREYLKTL